MHVFGWIENMILRLCLETRGGEKIKIEGEKLESYLKEHFLFRE